MSAVRIIEFRGCSLLCLRRERDPVNVRATLASEAGIDMVGLDISCQIVIQRTDKNRIYRYFDSRDHGCVTSETRIHTGSLSTEHDLAWPMYQALSFRFGSHKVFSDDPTAYQLFRG
ncbi:hypothetical protein RF11_05423 [Thelohanellus kitauei]|uniref:Uncharacterized protein n=1 Tax=Thelohanellus kitauei TaxID=669202 RepID=A0A0C2IJ32_THEKT|nr:hypothetical protein RF11_05423 [Thelohanellus kitauei]